MLLRQQLIMIKMQMLLHSFHHLDRTTLLRKVRLEMVALGLDPTQ